MFSCKSEVEFFKLAGVLAGFSRDIPGFPTYRMNGSVSLGEHHLVIESVQLSDDAEFQCQVTPAGGDPPLLASARLSVVGESLVGLGSSTSMTSHKCNLDFTDTTTAVQVQKSKFKRLSGHL